jgi:hypothetical protein
MRARRDITIGYLIIALPSIIMGGILALFVTNAFSRVMKHMMAGFMEKMSAMMRAEGSKPEET